MRSKTRFSDFCDVLFIEVSGERAWIKTEAEDPGGGHVEKFKSYHYSNG